MTNWKQIIARTSVATALLTLGASNLAEPASAFKLRDLDPTNPNGAVRRTLKDADPTNPNGSVRRNLQAKFRICNQTNGTVNYSLNNRNNSLRKGRCHNWTTPGQASISFDKRFASGYQRKSYVLNDGNYNFKNVDWTRRTSTGRINLGRGIDLKRAR